MVPLTRDHREYQRMIASNRTATLAFTTIRADVTGQEVVELKDFCGKPQRTIARGPVSPTNNDPEEPRTEYSGMQVVIVSDTHKKHEQLGVLTGDVLIHCGDFCDGFNVNDSDVDDLDDWFGRQQFELILCIGGNHDFAALDRQENDDEIFENAVYLEDEAIEFGGFRFYGAPWIPRLDGWAYFLPDQQRRERWEQIPDDTDVLITHTPPFGILDVPTNGTPQGCSFLRSRVEEIESLKLHCFGHIHASYGHQEHGLRMSCNAALQHGDDLKRPMLFEI